MQPRRLWYTRRGQVIRGPFPSGLIRRHLLLGRILDSDEISLDQIVWHPVSHYPELIPEELEGDQDDPEVKQRLHIARLREDERLLDRRENENEQDAVKYQRREGDRREPESDHMINRRQRRVRIGSQYQLDKRTGKRLAIFSLFVFFMILGIAYYFTPSNPILVVKCQEAGNGKISWNNCKKEGINLQGRDMAAAVITNTSLQGANLNSVNLSDSLLAYSNFSNANMEKILLRGARLKGAILRRANMKHADMQNVDAAYAVFQNSDLSFANLEKADLSKADFTGANVTGIKLTGARLGGAIWVDGKTCSVKSIGECQRIPSTVSVPFSDR